MKAIKATDYDALMKQANESSLEAEMSLIVRVLMQEYDDIIQPEREYKFHESRNWRFDFSWPEYMIAVEVEGGKWLQTKNGRSKGHLHPERFEKDCEKYNEATRLGWRVFRFTGDMIQDGRALETLEAVFPPF